MNKDIWRYIVSSSVACTEVCPKNNQVIKCLWHEEAQEINTHPPHQVAHLSLRVRKVNVLWSSLINVNHCKLLHVKQTNKWINNVRKCCRMGWERQKSEDSLGCSCEDSLKGSTSMQPSYVWILHLDSHMFHTYVYMDTSRVEQEVLFLCCCFFFHFCKFFTCEWCFYFPHVIAYFDTFSVDM